MVIKICGIREKEDIVSISKMKVDYVGFIFVPDSPRDASETLDLKLTNLFSQVMPPIKKVGVFVNADLNEIFDTIEFYHLDAVQLHGNESVENCTILSDNVEVIKTIKISNVGDFAQTEKYESHVSKFLFEAHGESDGGNGIKFDWSLLNVYKGETPFLLSGGIGPEDIGEILKITHPQFEGVDVNSKFEKYPGKKNSSALTTFVNAVKSK